MSGAGMMDGAIFFTMLFGSDRFAPLIGELFCATSARLSGTPGSDVALERAQLARIVTLAEKCVVFSPLLSHSSHTHTPRVSLSPSLPSSVPLMACALIQVCFLLPFSPLICA